MAIKQYNIGNEWQKISEAGQIGTCWIEKNKGNNPAAKLKIYHQTSPSLPGMWLISHGYPLRDPKVNFDATQLVPDDENDIFYAASDTPGVEFVINVDMRNQ